MASQEFRFKKVPEVADNRVSPLEPDFSQAFSLEDQPIDQEVQLLIDVLPERIRKNLYQQDLSSLIEVVMDLGRRPEARFRGGRFVELSDNQVTFEELNHVIKGVGHFTSDNRAGIPRTLHRISALRNRQGEIVGLTCRVGRVVTGTIDSIKDLVESGKSILFLGPPGVGKTTRLREISKMMADDLKKRVVIVDTSNEIAGDGDIPHPAVGRSRRIQVSSPEKQKEVMIEAVENHTPEVIVVDEIGTEDEAQASRTIAERGVTLVATAHGSTLENLIKNPVLSDLIGGIQAVTLGDEEAKRRATQKTVLEREKKPTFDICIEIRDYNTLAVYPDVAEAVDHLLRGWTIFPEVRRVDSETGATRILQSDVKVMPDFAESTDIQDLQTAVMERKVKASLSANGNEFRIFPYSISRAYIERIIERLNLSQVSITNHLYDADAVIALRGSARPGSKMLQLAADYEVPVYIAKTNTMPQIQRAMREAMNADAGTFAEKIAEEGGNETDSALREAEEAIEKMAESEEPIELAPRRSYIRRLQHELVEKNNLMSVSVGDEPNRRLKILPPGHQTSGLPQKKH